MKALDFSAETSQWNYLQDVKKLDSVNLALSASTPEYGYVLDGFGTSYFTSFTPKKNADFSATSSGIIKQFSRPVSKPLTACFVAMNILASQLLATEECTKPTVCVGLDGTDTADLNEGMWEPLGTGLLSAQNEQAVYTHDSQESIVADLERTLTMTEAAHEWDRITKLPTRQIIDLPYDLED